MGGLVAVRFITLQGLSALFIPIEYCIFIHQFEQRLEVPIQFGMNLWIYTRQCCSLLSFQIFFEGKSSMIAFILAMVYFISRMPDYES